MKTLHIGRTAFLLIGLMWAGSVSAADPVEAEPAVVEETPTETTEIKAEPAQGKPVFNAPGSKMVTVSYGYAMTDYEDATTDPEGWRINGTFEVRPTEKPLVHGITIGYMEVSAEREAVQTVDYKVKTVPIYYAPKIILGKKAIKVFAKGALGCHFSDYDRTGEHGGGVDANEFGFYGGGGLGAMVVLKNKFFINAEYEWVYMSNSYFQDGAVQSAMLGIGMQL